VNRVTRHYGLWRRSKTVSRRPVSLWETMGKGVRSIIGTYIARRRTCGIRSRNDVEHKIPQVWRRGQPMYAGTRATYVARTASSSHGQKFHTTSNPAGIAVNRRSSFSRYPPNANQDADPSVSKHITPESRPGGCLFWKNVSSNLCVGVLHGLGTRHTEQWKQLAPPC